MSRNQGHPLRAEDQCVQKSEDENVLGIFPDHQGGEQGWSIGSWQQNEVGKGAGVRTYRTW